LSQAHGHKILSLPPYHCYFNLNGTGLIPGRGITTAASVEMGLE